MDGNEAVEGAYDEMEDLDESFEDESDPDEAYTGRPIMVPIGKGSGNQVTHRHLQVALADIKRRLDNNAGAIRSVKHRVVRISKDQARINATLKRHAIKHDKVDKDIANIFNSLQMSMLLPMLEGQSSLLVKEDIKDSNQNVIISGGTKLAVPNSNTLLSMMPILFLPQMSSGTGIGGTGGIMDQSNMMMWFVLLLSMNKTA